MGREKIIKNLQVRVRHADPVHIIADFDYSFIQHGNTPLVNMTNSGKYNSILPPEASPGIDLPLCSCYSLVSIMKNRADSRINLIESLSRRKFLFGSLAFSGAVFADAWLRQPTDLEVSQTRLPISKIPSGKELRVVHLSDLHLHRYDRYFRQVAAATSTLNPDLILLTGDYVEEARNLSGVLDFLAQLKAPAGVFAVQGNWEYWALIEGKNLRDKFRSKGVELLINQRADIDYKGVAISILGIDFPSPSGSVQQLNDAAEKSRVNIALSHVPAFQHEIMDDTSDLILCGHTHGGQVRLPMLKPFHLPRHSGRFVDGLYRVGKKDTPLYVTRGIGTSIMPLRFFCPPEINLIRLVGV